MTLARVIALGDDGRGPVQHDIDRAVALINAAWWAQRDYDRADALIDAARRRRIASVSPTLLRVVEAE